MKLPLRELAERSSVNRDRAGTPTRTCSLFQTRKLCDHCVDEVLTSAGEHMDRRPRFVGCLESIMGHQLAPPMSREANHPCTNLVTSAHPTSCFKGVSPPGKNIIKNIIKRIVLT